MAVNAAFLDATGNKYEWYEFAKISTRVECLPGAQRTVAGLDSNERAIYVNRVQLGVR